MSGCHAENLVFLDESSVNTNMTRGYARAMGGARVVDAAPVGHPKSTTILSSIRMDGSTAYTVFSGGTTKERFAEYMKNILIPTLDKDALVIMDNMRSHHAEIVRQLLDDAGVHYCYLPPYSPDLNPIEMMWSKIKATLRREKARAGDVLAQAIAKAFSLITPKDCKGWFTADDYMR